MFSASARFSSARPAAQVQLAFQSVGYRARLVEATGRYARLVLRLPGSGDEVEVDLLKEALEPGWVTVPIGTATSVRALLLHDAVGLKARAWHDRFVIRDIVDLHAVADVSPMQILRRSPAAMTPSSI